MSDGIAIVGMSCRYPDAADVGELWQTVLGRRRAFRRLPGERLAMAYRGAPDEAERTYVTTAGVLRDWQFDRERFGVPGPLYRAADQTHWLALETAADALADAGYPEARGLDRDRVGVILGNTLTGEFTRAAQLRYRWPFLHRAASAALDRAGVEGGQAAETLATLEELVKQPFPVPGDESLAGALANTIAGRICNHFDLGGTGYTVDGACSSSLLAVLHACRALVSGELDFALAGGVDLSLDPFELVGFSRLGALADGEMRIYDSRPTGFLPGEGAGVVALMRASDAEAAGLRPYATVIGWGTSSDGAGGLTRPEETGQARALQRAYRIARVDPVSVGLIEGHGTGTAVGDAVELQALSRMRGADAPRAALGSIKANIGHTKAAAGVAGLIKATLALHHRVLPPTTGCDDPHELLRRNVTPLRILEEPELWTGAVRRASVSSMGFGGINAHVVLEGPSGRSATVPPAVRAWSRPLPPAEIVLLSAPAQAELAGRLEAIAARGPQLSKAELHDLAATEHDRYRNQLFRCALVAGNPETLAEQAEKARERLSGWDGRLVVHEGGYVLASGPPAKVGLLFPGQASPVRTKLDWWARDLDVPGLPDDHVHDGDTDTAVAQPVILRQSLAAIAWLDAIGCRAVGAAGHSLGEISALVWAGALTPDHGLALAARRGRLMADYAMPGTTMASLGVDAGHVRELLAGLDVSVSGVNAPDQTTVAGPRADVAAVVDRARRRGIPATTLPVSHGFHSEAMRPVRAPLRNAVRSLEFGPLSRPVFSTVTGGSLPSRPDLRDLLVEQLTEPVRFTDALAGLSASCDLLVEAGSGTTLTTLAGPGGTAVSMDCGVPARHALATAAIVAAGAGSLEPWFAGRAYRTLDIDTPMTFLANPCEVITAPLTEPAATHRPATPEPEADGQGEPIDVVRRYLSTALELPVSSIGPGRTLLGDLHLNSLQVLQTVAAVAQLLGVEPPAMPETLADATVQDVSELLAAQPENTRGPDGFVGVRPWVRSFEHHWVPFTPESADRVPSWTVDAPAGHWLAEAATAGQTAGIVFWLGDDTEVPDVARILRRIGSERPGRVVVVHEGHPAAAAIARSAVVEHPDCAATVVEVPRGGRVGLEVAAGSGYRELRVKADGTVERAVTRASRRGETGRLPVGPGDVCLVTGGLSGITALCAKELAEHTGCTVVVLGRSDRQAPEGMHYVQCDLTERDDVRRAVKTARELGPVRAVLHGAGINEPRVLAEVTPESLERTLAPKVWGADLLVSEVEDEIRLLAGFGSIIGRRGLSGQSEYCVANDWLRHSLSDWARSHPACLTRVLEWSVWDEIGMAPRMGVVEVLRSQGIMPIEPVLGARAMIDVLSDADAPETLLVSARVPDSPTLTIDGPALSPLRFTEEIVARVPGVEAVTESELSLGTDPYLDEHRVDGVPVLPAVVGLEAMAQTAASAGWHDGWCFSDVRLRSPVLVGEHSSRMMRVASLTTGANADVVVRDDSDGYAADRFTATLRSAPPAPPVVAVKAPLRRKAGSHPYYGPLFFHTGRFQRLARYERLTAFQVTAWITASRDSWFSEFHDGRLLLGDPGAHDATIHVLQGCVPHRRVLPVGIDELTFWRKPEGLIQVRAEEREHTADEYLFDVHTTDAEGRAVSRWLGLRLRAVGPIEWSRPMPVPLAGPMIARRLIEAGIDERAEISTMDYSGGSQPLDDGDTGLAAIVAQRTGEEHATSADRVRRAREAVACQGALELHEIVDTELVLLRCGDTIVATGAVGPVVVATTISDSRRR
jgi:enediyne polyketide synthase